MKVWNRIGFVEAITFLPQQFRFIMRSQDATFTPFRLALKLDQLTSCKGIAFLLYSLSLRWLWFHLYCCLIEPPSNVIIFCRNTFLTEQNSPGSLKTTDCEQDWLAWEVHSLLSLEHNFIWKVIIKARRTTCVEPAQTPGLPLLFQPAAAQPVFPITGQDCVRQKSTL